MSGHTAGPWVVNPICAQVDCGKESRIGGLLPVARMLWPTDERSEAETEANARLIAAAPDLLSVMLDLFENPEFQVAIGGNPIRVEVLMNSARAAISKARGEA